MAGRTTAAKRYAQAIAAIARTDNSWEQWRQDLAVVQEALQNPDLRLTLESPRITAERKKALLDETLGTRVAPATKNLLTVIGRRGRFNLFADVAVWFDDIADRALDVRRHVVTSAVPLTDQQRQRLLRQLSEEGGKVVLTEQVDLALIGGFVVRHEDLIHDYSIRTRLETLRARLN